MEAKTITTSPNEIWSRVQSALKDVESAAAYKMWISEIHAVKCENNTLYLSVPGSIHQEIVEKRYVNDIKTIISGIFDLNLEIAVVCENAENEVINDMNHTDFIHNIEGCDGTALNPDYTFDTFIVGSTNRFAHAAAFAVAESPAMAYNPLFIHGGSGLGKTHLMQAVGNYIKRNNPSLKIMYVTSEQFTNELVNSIREKTNEEFRNKYRSVDVLMVDDIQFIANKEATQEEFFHTFNALHGDKKQIVLTSDRPAKVITNLEERLRSRFDWGIVVDIQPPDYEIRVAILKAKAESIDLYLPEPFYGYIADCVKSNVRELEGVLNRLKVYIRLEGKSVTVDTINEAINYYKDQTAKMITPDYIIETVGKYFSVSVDNILSARKTKDLVEARHFAMYFIRDYTDLSLPAIGEIFGRDHTTVLSGLRKIETNLKNGDKMTENLITELRNNIEDVM